MSTELKIISIHSLVRGRTPTCGGTNRKSYHFNPLPRKRENGKAETLGVNIDYFNPLPRKRENLWKWAGAFTLSISIHSLVRGRTQMLFKRLSDFIISIHSLVRGRTFFFYVKPAE